MIYTNSKWEKYMRAEDGNAYIVTTFAKLSDDPRDSQSMEQPRKMDVSDYAKNYSPISRAEGDWISPDSLM